MTKKDYVSIAGIISAGLQSGGDLQTLQGVTTALCSVFEKENPRFSRESFENATGISSYKSSAFLAPAPRRLAKGGGGKSIPDVRSGSFSI